ncbi:MAG: fibronectin type III domain-containing protein [Spirochaetales bacterium]|nr:fibronectin type III domain-containing protein [Spirochaetales bacterium]
MLNQVCLRSYFKLTLIISLFFIILNTAWSEAKVLTLGGKEGWPALSKKDGIVTGKGRFGYDAMVLATNSRKVNYSTDLLLDFEDETFSDKAGNYTVERNSLYLTENSIMGKKAALVKGTGGLRLKGSGNSFFGKEGMGGSFTIEFWLFPFIAENGEIVFSWRSSRTVANYPLYQMIRASFFNNHLQWTFTNIFSGYIENGGEVNLSSYRTIIPNTWSHHSISYNEENGLLEYRIDSQLEDLKYVSTNKKEKGGSVYPLHLGVAADIDICPEFSGVIDDFNILRNASSEKVELQYDTFKKSGGRFETQPILVTRGASLTKIDGIVTKPEQTEILFYVRGGDNFYNWTDTYPEWKRVELGENISNVKGLYFQVGCNLYPDGGGSKSPSVTELQIYYEETPLPLPPFSVKAQSGDSQVTLNWSFSVDENAGGYYIFYGERPGEYLGREAVQGESPVDIGNTTSAVISGLENGKIYYFAIAAYSKTDNQIMGELSKEVYARPLRR